MNYEAEYQTYYDIAVKYEDVLTGDSPDRVSRAIVKISVNLVRIGHIIAELDKLYLGHYSGLTEAHNKANKQALSMVYAQTKTTMLQWEKLEKSTKELVQGLKKHLGVLASEREM